MSAPYGFFVLDGHTVVRSTFDGWREWMNTTPVEDRTVEQTAFDDESTVSTVFIGGIFMFETLVMGGPMDDLCIRNESWEEAELAHKLVVAAIEAKLRGADAAT